MGEDTAPEPFHILKENLKTKKFKQIVLSQNRDNVGWVDSHNIKEH